jgi:acyl dehydratase
MWREGDALGPWRHEITREQLVRYAGASGDFNPIHYDDDAARRFGLPGVIAHGMLNMGLMARRLMEAAPPGARLAEYGVRFRSMVRPGDAVVIEGRITRLEAKGSERVATVALTLGTEDGSPAVTGQAILVWTAND